MFNMPIRYLRDIGEHMADGKNEENADESQESLKVIVDFPGWMIVEFDKEAKRLWIPRQAVIKTWLDQQIQQMKRNKAG